VKKSILTGGSLILGFQAQNLVAMPFETAQSPATLHGTPDTHPLSQTLTPFVQIDKSGTITIYNPRPDMGQGSSQALPAIIAEELCVPFSSITIKQTEGEAKFGNQNAGGSGSVRGLWKPLRIAGAAAREMLVTAAAQAWSVPVSECVAENAMVIHKPNGQPSGKAIRYGELVEAASKLTVPTNPQLKDPSQFTIIGKAIPRPDVPMKVNGKAQFAIDARVEGMLYASIEHSPVLHGKVMSFNEKAAKRIRGVKYVLKCERPLFGRILEGVAVLADSTYAAMQGRKALAVKWDEGEYNKLSTDALYASMRQSVQTKDGIASESSHGDVRTAFAHAARTLEAQYETPFLAHAPMEPEAVIASYNNGNVEIWASTQGAPWTIGAVARHFNIPKENIIVHPLFLGGSFGRKGGLDDFVLEAVYLSKKVGAPVKLTWTREDDITQGPFRPGMVSVLKAGIDAEGKLVALQHKYATPSIQSQFRKPESIVHTGSLESQFSLPISKFDDWTGEGIEPQDSPYGVPNVDIRFVQANTQIPVMWWRSVYASTNVFGQESFIDEIAHAIGRNPLSFRLDVLEQASEKDRATAARFQAVLKTLAEQSRWSEPLPSGKGRGMAISRSFASICAHAVTVGRNAEGKLTVESVVSVLDCGMYVNPDNVKAQVEGSIVMGLTAALKQPITFKNGRAEQTNFDSYAILRIHEMPTVNIHLMNNGEPPGGVGEPALPAVAPALANAIFAATGKRLRSLPLNLEAL
jgi:isoquinoline 1-oxidoreductase beta subunit